ncbi:hypothetical protein YERSI8AC_290108 [Enterobacterales bacterium 8AC]|nr:hypothetical protein YERSI8AC_290108 [Enterobacterales bacterium 8AC]
MVSSQRAFYRRRVFQRGFLYRRHVGPTSGGVGHRSPHLETGVYHRRDSEPNLDHLLAIFYKHPKDQKKLSSEERTYILEGQEAQHRTSNAKKMSAWQIVRNRQFWGIALPRFLAEPAWGTFNAWIPLFMFKAYGFNLKEIAMFAWMPMLFADLGCIMRGYLPPFFQKHFKVNLIVSRKLVVTVGHC